jgi:hypothetical protein
MLTYKARKSKKSFCLAVWCLSYRAQARKGMNTHYKHYLDIVCTVSTWSVDIIHLTNHVTDFSETGVSNSSSHTEFLRTFHSQFPHHNPNFTYSSNLPSFMPVPQSVTNFPTRKSKGWLQCAKVPSMSYKSNPVHALLLARFQNNGEKRLSIVMSSVGLEYRLLFFRRSLPRPAWCGSGPRWKIFRAREQERTG